MSIVSVRDIYSGDMREINVATEPLNISNYGNQFLHNLLKGLSREPITRAVDLFVLLSLYVNGVQTLDGLHKTTGLDKFRLDGILTRLVITALIEDEASAVEAAEFQFTEVDAVAQENSENPAETA